MSKTITSIEALRFEPSSPAQATEAYITAILRGTVFLARPEQLPPVRPDHRPTWFEAAGWPTVGWLR
jgi:hypothetical protein